ncbi:hypothetical protein [Candidatus Cyanaurora vandensis]|uniref:hypothetical protein n=1 Tax=Candidatus Cyanaurora vandensis TaxID=2714958 RepID=UPI00257B54E0|nr:hypothetical protein [Candidatus Cyanaurora vandensis]
MKARLARAERKAKQRTAEAMRNAAPAVKVWLEPAPGVGPPEDFRDYPRQQIIRILRFTPADDEP